MKIKIKQACEQDIKILEAIYLEAVNWLESINNPMWDKDFVSWAGLSREFKIENFHIAYINNEPAGCMALVDNAPFFWPEKIEKGAALFLRRLAVRRDFAGQGLSAGLFEYAAELCRERNINALRLDCDSGIEKLNKIYEDFGFICEKKEVLVIGGEEYPTAFYVYNIN